MTVLMASVLNEKRLCMERTQWDLVLLVFTEYGCGLLDTGYTIEVKQFN